MPQIILIAHNIRSAHNVGSLLRSADGLGIEAVYLTGYSPYPVAKNDARLPHLAARVSKQINKTALGAEHSVDWQHFEKIEPLLAELKSKGYHVVALEQAPNSIDLAEFTAPAKLALIVGREVEGIETEVLAQADVVIEIPMQGAKESLNVATAAAIAIYSLKNQA